MQESTQNFAFNNVQYVEVEGLLCWLNATPNCNKNLWWKIFLGSFLGATISHGVYAPEPQWWPANHRNTCMDPATAPRMMNQDSQPILWHPTKTLHLLPPLLLIPIQRLKWWPPPPKSKNCLSWKCPDRHFMTCWWHVGKFWRKMAEKCVDTIFLRHHLELWEPGCQGHLEVQTLSKITYYICEVSFEYYLNEFRISFWIIAILCRW